jgi:hypothetical protein
LIGQLAGTATVSQNRDARKLVADLAATAPSFRSAVAGFARILSNVLLAGSGMP